ncbi:midasin isoform X2 [Malania oleifera]|uniref:midasin isoform X2 n=1 Tax=Malania oleifera TaxID=397392 RepID=UPI0025AE9096|nr:midasin isoform X2 [Malania oleifera]
MAIDGSFNLEAELKRFIARCPRTEFILSPLFKKGDMLTEEKVVASVAVLFLHPNYTIPLVGCFRPIAQNIVDKAVALLRLVPNLRSNSEDIVAESNTDKSPRGTENFPDADVANVIDFYVGRGRGLNLHELACLAFCRALDLAPFLLGSVLTYFKFAPPPFECILKSRLVSGLSIKASAYLLNPVRTSCRLLLMEPEVFSKLWDWSCFLELVHLFANLSLGENTELSKNISDMRWCSIRIFSVILKMSECATKNFCSGSEETLGCLLRWEEFCQDVSLEKAGWYFESPQQDVSGSVNGDIDVNGESSMQLFDLNSLAGSLSINEIEPSVKRRPLTWNTNLPSDPFVLTSTVKKSFEMVQLAVSQKWPVLLYGPVGAGKSALISKLARDSANRVLSIHMDDQIDGKTLVGGYVCAEKPGEFKWQPGSLTLAVLNGFWVVFEDIDKAPPDVHSILLPLLEGVGSFVTGHGEAIQVAERFRLFSTVSSSKLDVSRFTGVGTSLGVLWRRVLIRLSSNEDLKNIVNAWYPSLEPLTGRLIETFERVNSAVIHQHAGFQSGKFDSFLSFSRFSLRDLLKWCKRIAGLGFSFVEDQLSSYIYNCIYQEAVDIFAASSASAENRLTIMREIAKLWALCIPVSESLYPPNKPVIQDSLSDMRIGRVTLQCFQTAFRDQKKPFVEIRSSMHLLERIACSVKHNEPVLLVGETGTGKTTLVQNLAARLGQKLTVLNLSQQSDVADLLGGFKPTDARFVCIPLYNEFENLFSRSFPVKANNTFLANLQKYLSNKNWVQLLRGFQKVVRSFETSSAEGIGGSGKKRKKPLDERIIKAWENFSVKLETAHGQVVASSGMVFSFVEGAFVSALKHGDWILLDEVNLAPPETLQRITGVLEGDYGSFCLAERGDVDYIHRHPNFRIFACMNPATDAGKRDLPLSLCSRFTEYFVDDVLDDGDLSLFINQFMDDNNSNIELVNKIMHFYKAAKKGSEEKLQDGANQKPQYSLRSLYRALEYTKKARKKFEFQRALYDGFCMFFLTLLDGTSAKLMNQMILSYLLGGKIPRDKSFDAYLMARDYLVSDDFLESYVLTKSVKEHLKNLARSILIKRYPVLLQGPTSSGKTSLVQYLAAITGHEFVRINNHEHTDLQEYLGSYITDACGKLVFHEGVLVKAVRNGYWIVLDELNLAPSDVLEALNRLLDDNRELFVPELCETVHAHPDFMLFATQNPPTFYGGRKMLSRAFRNRFVEIHVDEIPENELSTILERRCKIPESYAKKMVEVMKELQLHRQRSKVFAGKHGFITPRDLFRWADRFRTFGSSYEDLARDGYFLLAEKLRDESEKNVVQEVLERHLRVKLVRDDLYVQESAGGDSIFSMCRYSGVSENIGNIIWTKSMWRLYYLVERCYKLREPVLLVGETGGGKTTVCQLLSIILGSKLHILNCHQYTETSDFLGGFYPIRERSQLTSKFKYLIEQVMMSKTFKYFPGDTIISPDIGQAPSTLNQLSLIINSYRKGLFSCSDVTLEDLKTFEQLKLDLVQLSQQWQTIFTWQDGPLVQAMKEGNLFLVDEISLADDSVLERLNSVLEPERKLSLAEKGGSDLEKIAAHPNFFVLATMNPGGDYGKKELSPALRNRFTEIWVPAVTDLEELRSIAQQRFLRPELLCLVDPMLHFWGWFNQLQVGRVLTVRDLLSWVDFINLNEKCLEPKSAFLHGVFMVLLDGLSLGTAISKRDVGELRKRCLSFLLEQLKVRDNSLVNELSEMESYGWGDLGVAAAKSSAGNLEDDTLFGINPFYIEKGNDSCEGEGFEFMAPTTRRNASRVLRAMQLVKPVLLEGSPGVGKTSLIVALGKFSGHRVVRINLSEQTDIMDLLGSDLPIESEEGLKFSWSDGILLQALKKGFWILLDELNLAPQSVLEGLNAILDHRAEVFVPELNHSFKCPSSFRVFACQNPSCQGGGRKGLPKSFLNRFTKVYVDELVEDDYHFICSSIYPLIPRPVLSKLIVFNKRLYEETMLYHKFAQDGSPWEFNLRDVIRSCQLIEGAPEELEVSCFLNIIYLQRMRTDVDRREVLRLYEEIFGVKPSINPYPRVQLNPHYLIVGRTAIKRTNNRSYKNAGSQLKILPGIRFSLEAAARCVQLQWLCILIGPSASGKTSLIRLLAQLTGNVLNELNLSSATDISEILGCFEQFNAVRNFRFVIAQAERYMNEFCSLQLESSTNAFVCERDELIGRWLVFLSSVDSVHSLSSASAYVEYRKTAFNSLTLLVEIIERLQSDLQKYILPVSWSCNELNRTLKMVLKLQKNFQSRSLSTKFEWVAGLLIKAIENGEWIVLENANLCNPTVLDRINSLVEPQGSITVNECGIVDGEPVVLQPHPNFRMFLTVNPSYGEVSRAMRNRGVEIFMMPPYWLPVRGSGDSYEEAEQEDVKRFLVLSGIPIGKLVDIMAKAHIYARDEGLRLNVRITYLELARWVHLFQKLLVNGNQPFWSLETSWESTYISSLGEAEGWEIIAHAKISYLSRAHFSKFGWSLGSLCFPGGWPMPLRINDFVWNSKEISVRQNCMYLEFLGAQCASYEFSNACNLFPFDQALFGNCCTKTYLVDMKTLCLLMFPNASKEMTFNYSTPAEFNPVLANKMLLFAANWTIEQATEGDLKLYLLWFSWLGSQLQPFCQFFSSFLSLLDQEMEHPIWKCINRCRHELLSRHNIDLDSHPIPILSFDLVNLDALNEISLLSSKLLSNAIKCVGLLRLTLQQWNAESRHNYSDKTRCFTFVFRSLHMLEEEILNILVDSPSFDVLVQFYNELLQDHILFWNSVSADQFEYLPISWHSLMKNAARLQEFCPEVVETFLLEGKNLNKVLPWGLNLQKSMLWSHGGHPFLPSSSDAYYKQHQLFSLCELIWPTKAKYWEPANNSIIKVVASSNPELRFLAMQGVCMSFLIMGECEENDAQVFQQLDEMHQMLLERFEHEKQKLEANMISNEHAFPVADSAACCSFYPVLLCRKSGFASWLETIPIIDNTSLLLDLELLNELAAAVLVDAQGLQQALFGVAELLKFALNFSLHYSSRSPINLLPHQKILWMLDAWMSVDAAGTKIASFVLEMWFRWHSSLWTNHPICVESFSMVDDCDIPQPCMLFQPVKIAAVVHIMQSTFAVKDFPVHCLKLRVASRNLWQCYKPRAYIPRFLLSAARSLFKQIIYAHRKSFDDDKYFAIKSILSSLQSDLTKQDDIQTVCSLIATSKHHKLTSLIDQLIKPLLGELYIQCTYTDSLDDLGCAWLRIGGLRLQLLLSCKDFDPVMKYSYKHSHLLEKISFLELEIKVRQECDYLAGWFSTREADKQKLESLENLKGERRRLQRKIVFRSDPGKFKKLKCECEEFLKVVTSPIEMMKNIAGMDIQQLTDQICNWQETATCFIQRLSDEYTAYIDIVQPIQVAVYEIKLGLSLTLSSALQKKFLTRVEQDNMDRFLETIYSFMRFPRGCASKSIYAEVNSSQPYCNIHFPTNIWAVDLSFMEKLVSITRDDNVNKMVVLPKKAAIHENILGRITHSVANARLLDSASFMLLDKMFDEFASFWMDMKVQTRNTEEFEAQKYKFRPRVFKIEHILEFDISGLCNSFTNESFSEWLEAMSDDEFCGKQDASEEHNTVVEEWNLLQDNVWNNMVHIHSQLFGSIDLNVTPGIIQVPDSDRLLSFIDSYTLGAGMIKDLGGLSSSILDSKLLPENLLRLCLEHERAVISSRKSALKYNFYKDSNAPVMAKMVSLLMHLQHRILYVLSQLEDHPGLKKILDIVDMLLAIPMSTPLAKALSGLQFLLNKAQMLQENGSKFSLYDELQPILALMTSWQKMEFDSWPVLLDEVQDQYEINAGKLWFPLYSVLQRRYSSDIAGYNQSTIQSLEEFIHTSSIGEFRKRLELLFAFHGQIKTGICLGSYSNVCQMENLKILYNVFGFYTQLLPIILDHIETNRRNIETELKEFLKLCHWERSENYLSMENVKRTRQKLRKLIQKYNDLLQQPVMLILNQEVELRGVRTQSVGALNHLGDFSGKNEGILKAAFHLTQFTDRNSCSSMCFDDWRKKVDLAMQTFPEFSSPYLCTKDYEEVANIIRKNLNSHCGCLVHKQEWRAVWHTLEKICGATVGCRDLWKDENKTIGKRRALSGLLKLLESCGLSRHKPVFFEDQLQSTGWFVQPSYDGQHLLLTQDMLSSANVEIAASSQSKSWSPESLDIEWKTVNHYYFKSMASVQLLQQICLNFHKDFTLEQVNRSGSFLYHLIVIQQEQRASAYDFAEHLGRLRKCVSSLKNLCLNATHTGKGIVNKWSLTPNQHATLKCMWQQKYLFDHLCGMLYEESLLLRTVERAHLTTCESVKAAAKRVLGFVEKFVPIFQNSKELLDYYLLGNDGVITTREASLHPHVMSEQMEKMVLQNFQAIREFEEQLSVFCGQDLDKRTVKEALLSHFDHIIVKGKLMEKEFKSALEKEKELKYLHEEAKHCHENYSELEAGFSGALQRTLKHIIDAFQNLDSLSGVSEDLLGKLTSWKVIFQSYVANLQLDIICNELLKTIFYAREVVNHSGSRIPTLCAQTGEHLKHLHMLLDILLNFGDGLLHDFLSMNKMVSILATLLANVFASLYSKGFGTSMEDEVGDIDHNTHQDAQGTGMGEGTGMNDVSDQINDEDQLLGTSEKPTDDKDDSSQLPGKNDKGIEMEQDFSADAFSLSEESGEDNDDNSENEQLESAVGEAGPDSEVIDEKSWDKDEDENPNNKNEKYEFGPSVKDKDLNDREIRAKDDHATTTDEPGELNPGGKKQDDENGNQDDLDGTENVEDMNMDKEDAYMDPTGIKLDDISQGSDKDTDVDKPESADSMDGEYSDKNDEPAENENGEGTTNLMDETVEDLESEKVGGNIETEDQEGNDGENQEVDLLEARKNYELGNSNFNSNLPNYESASQPKADLQAADSGNFTPEMKWSYSSDIYNNLGSVRGLPSHNISSMEIMLGDTSLSGTLTDDQPKTQLPQPDSSCPERTQPNPYRSVGDALEEWKDRIKVSTDIQEGSIEPPEDTGTNNADEYGYVFEFEKGTAQALGPATSDQIDRNISDNKPDEDGHRAKKEEIDNMEIEKQASDVQPIRRYPTVLENKIEEQFLESKERLFGEGFAEVSGHSDCDIRNPSESLVTIKKCCMDDDILQCNKLPSSDDGQGKVKNLEEVSSDTKDNATGLWRKYELLTTRLSQELAEQLRLVMEPTLASKLQGDYKTGKRINMKKVIPYIASHYRKDKIWLRRTRPNKRDYQVVIAVDDSRSMSESSCGNVAIEALVTVCRAMSQLEVGNLAVASFGKKGNIRLLHDFDQPFTGEAGVKMISSLSFKQENTIADEPVVDLLKYLNNMLDAAVANARLPSGINPLQQLVLIIADGRFHEKENLKRCVREVLSRKRMIAFLLLDSPQESIMHLMEAAFQGGDIKFSKYLDSFPFPYYIVLKNIEELPRTLADLLRQWFELTQNARD